MAGQIIDADVIATRQDRPAFERSLAARLVAAGKLDEAAADRALRLRAGSEERLEQILTKLGLVHERDVAEAMAGELDPPLVDPGDFPEAPVRDSASPKFLRQARVLPLINGPDSLVLAVVDPLDEYPVRSL